MNGYRGGFLGIFCEKSALFSCGSNRMVTPCCYDINVKRKGGDGIALQEKMLLCCSREAIVTVKTYDAGIMDGCLQHPRLNGKEEIRSLSQMVLLLDGLLDLEHCPNQPPPLICPGDDLKEGMDIFRIQILFREHYTWQGRLVWQNQNQEYAFRSAVELLQLLDEILAQ